ncbi:glycogen debranching protein GlgX [Amycolatopsis nivea]
MSLQPLRAAPVADPCPAGRIAGFDVREGRPLPFGASRVPGGVNFSVYSTGATSASLVLFWRGAEEPFAELEFPGCYRTGSVYAMTVFGLCADEIEYGYRIDGPWDPERGDRYDAAHVLSDPYATAIGGRETWGEPGDGRYRYRSRIAPDGFDWAGDRPLGLPMQDLVIYETHVRGFTRHPSSGVRWPGTFAGLAERIPYLAELGVNCVELMPVLEFDENENHPAGLHNYWGYNTVGFFAPKASYAATGVLGRQSDELKSLVKQLHAAGIEVVLDVVFNHTAEGDERGPTFSFRGLDNRVYYMLTPDGRYYNFSGTGNTVNCNHPVVLGFVLDCLRHWVSEYHVDGFRFDLAAVLGRASDGSPLANPPLLETLASDPVLAHTKLIAEAWDAGGLYQVGSFPDYCRWSEWNGRYRDAVRRFLKGEPGTVSEMADRLIGSPDLYLRRGPVASVNFVTSHDGFTLHDLFAYNDKHNDANGEHGGDGDDANHSWNCGHEGPAGDPDVLALRRRQVCNALLLLLMSHGVPMLLAGDEIGRTQQGNNNAYCHDSEISWLDWRGLAANADLLRFVKRAIAFRHAHPVLRRRWHITGHANGALFPDVSWHGVRAWTPDWSSHNRLLAVMFHAEEEGAADCVYLAANAHWEWHDLELPELPDRLAWHRFADTHAELPAEEPGAEPELAGQERVRIGPRTVLVLVARERRGR